MGWARRTRPGHRCDLAVRENSFGHMVEGAAKLGDLYRCPDCRALWRSARACDLCDRHGPGPHRGQHTVGIIWRPATFWQRLARRRTINDRVKC